MAVARLVQGEKIAYSDGKSYLLLPSEVACRERIVKLLDDAGGDIHHALVHQFWLERSNELGSSDELKAAWAMELYERLNKYWDELTEAPSTVEDAFSMFGL
jgi:hypothetical protein